MARENKTFFTQMTEAKKILKKTSDIQKAWATPLIMRVHPPKERTESSSINESAEAKERPNKVKR